MLLDRTLWQCHARFNPPEADGVLMCPWAFVRFMWYTTSKEFRAWPTTLDSGIVIGWRWPWKKKFREAAWVRKDEMPLAVYGAMDQAYTTRVIDELGLEQEKAKRSEFIAGDAAYIAPTVRKLLQQVPLCLHGYWTASCPECARKALTLAVQLTRKYERPSIPDPHEDPYKAFLRREEIAKKQLAEIERARLEAGNENR